MIHFSTISRNNIICYARERRRGALRERDSLAVDETTLSKSRAFDSLLCVHKTDRFVGSVNIRAEKFHAGVSTRVRMTMDFAIKSVSMKNCVIVIPLTDTSRKSTWKKIM